MADERYGRIHIRPSPQGPEYHLVPPQAPQGGHRNRSADGRYKSDPLVPSPPRAERRLSSGEYPQRVKKVSEFARVPSPPRVNVRENPLQKRQAPSPYIVTPDSARETRPLEHRRMASSPTSPRYRTPAHSEQDSEQDLLSPTYQGKNVVRGVAPTMLHRSKSDRGSKPARFVQKATSDDWGDETSSNALTISTGGDESYWYRPLQDLSIRLIRILPERKTMIKCEIIHVSIEDPPPYVAVSYAWGDAGDTRKIEVEGSSISISVSLHGAFEALRQRERSVLVWADALSINQRDGVERAQQIQLMPNIYSGADSVAVWLGFEAEDSLRAVDFLREVAVQAKYPQKTPGLLSFGITNGDLMAVVSLFKRDYWRRLWVAQEIFYARNIVVYCGSTKVPWDTYQVASNIFNQYRDRLSFKNEHIDKKLLAASPEQFSHTQVLIHQGPASFPDLGVYMDESDDVLLDIMRVNRRKLASDAKDKFFGILGVLPTDIRNEFRADYTLSVKDVYTEIVDYLLKTTQRLDVICEAIHFPMHTGPHSLPSFVPDWSHIPQTTSLGQKYDFSAAGSTKARCKFLDQRLNKLEILAIPLDEIKIKGVAVGTLCNLGDYLMAFLHWRALVLENFSNEGVDYLAVIQEDFAATLSLGHVPATHSPREWLICCYNLFANLLRERLPYLPLDETLYKYLNANIDIKSSDRREYLQKHFGDGMMGRSFCITQESRLGMGTGFMLPGDQVVVPLGCSTPILLRPEGASDEYRFVGDVYIHGYMTGRAAEHWKEGKRNLKKYVLH